MGATSELHIQMQDAIMQTIAQVEGGELGYLDGLFKLRDNKKALETSLELIKAFEDENQSNIEFEAGKYPEGYMGHKVSVVSGRRTFVFKNIPEIEEQQSALKETEKKYQAAFDGFQKGIVQTTRLNENDPDSPLGWVDENGSVLPFPDVNISKSYIKVEQLKPKKK